MASVDPWAEYERLSSEDPRTLTAAELRLLAIGGLRSDVNNGGFHQYFFNTAGDLALEAADAAAVAGAGELDALVRHALTRLNLSEPADRHARQAALNNIHPDDFEDLNAAFYALEESIDLDAVMRDVMRTVD
jgi:hypothetical protein